MDYNFIDKRIRNIIEMKSGYTWSTDQETNISKDKSVRVLTVTNIQKTLDKSYELYLNNVSEKDKEEKKVTKGWTISVGSNGNRNRIGNCVYIDEDTEYLFASFLVGFKPKELSGVLPEYFFRWMSSDIIQRKISTTSEGTTGLGNFNTRYFKNLIISFPEDTEIQKRIIEILKAVDELINTTQESIEKTEKLRKSLMQNLLTGKLKPDGTWRKEEEFCLNTSDSISMKTLQFFLNKLRPINWKFIGLFKIINLVYGNSLTGYSDTRGNYPVFGSNGIIGYTDNYLIKGPGIIVGRKGTIGAINWSNEDFYPIDTTYYVDIIDKEINLKWVYYILNFLNLPKLNSATGVPGLNKNDALSLYTIVPPIEEQLSIVSVLEQFENEIQSKEYIIYNLNRLKKSLLQNLLTGKVKIKN